MGDDSFPLSGAHATTSTTSTTTSTSTTTTTTPTSAKCPTFTAVVCTIAVTSSSSSCTGQVADAGVRGRIRRPARSPSPPRRHGRDVLHARGDSRLARIACTVSYIPSANLVQGEPPPVSAGCPETRPSRRPRAPPATSRRGPRAEHVVATPVGGIPNNLINQNPYVVSADERLTVPGTRTRSCSGPAWRRPPWRRRTKQIGSASYKLRPLASIAATIKLTAAGRKLLAKHKTLNAVLHDHDDCRREADEDGDAPPDAQDARLTAGAAPTATRETRPAGASRRTAACSRTGRSGRE